MAQSDARFGYRAKLSRTDHDLSQPFGFTSAPGQLLPIWFDIATPGDSYYMSHDMPLLRSIQLVAPAMVNVKVHYETFFVPMQMIYEPFENTVYSLKNVRSSLYDMSLLQNQNLPMLDYTSAIKTICSGVNLGRMDAFRLADLLGLDALNFITRVSEGDQPVKRSNFAPGFFPFQLLAYHTIFQYYYRLDDKTQFSNECCNFDKYYATQLNVFPNPVGLFQVHQRPWDFDYFTSAYNSPIVSNENMQSILPSGQYSTLVFANQSPTDFNGSVASSNENVTSFSPGTTSPSGDAVRWNRLVNSSLIRQLFANEKLAMITGRTKKNYDAQTLAHYGVPVPHDVKHDITLLHHDTFDLHVQEVTSLASTEQSPLGELAGKSYAAGNGKQFKFTAPCHGVIMTIFSIEPKKRYITQFDRINIFRHATDVPTPEFDRLGNVPMYRYEVGGSYGGSSQYDIIKWKERYFEYKRKPAKVTWFAFAANGLNNFGSYFLSSMPFAQSSFTTQDSEYYAIPQPQDPQQRYAYIEPGCMDSLCVAHYVNHWLEDKDGENWSAAPWLVYARDPFIVDSHVKCKKVSWMSNDGEPIYD